jgi:2-dehydro-3-deoxyglucarate aldolase/4-hydroxy-2-oxoheptanedioate aldolase
MKSNRYRQAIAQGRIPVGHMVWEFATRGIAKLLDSVDLDFVVYDMEHSGIDTERMFDLIAWSKAASYAPFVRVPQAQYHFLARIMDAGALGVMIGNVQTPEEARMIVESVKFAPLGKRGVGLGTAHTDFVVPDPVTYFRESNESSVVICQIESPLGVANAEAIAATPGVDILWVGHFDLSQSMGIPGEFQNPRFLEALQAVVAAANKHGKRLGIQPGNMEQAQQWMSLGFNVISWGADSAVYRAAIDTAVRNLRQHLP